MQFSVAAVLAFAAAGVSAHAFNNGTQTYVTEVVTAYTTFCPVATEITAGGKTYTVTSVCCNCAPFASDRKSRGMRRDLQGPRSLTHDHINMTPC